MFLAGQPARFQEREQVRNVIEVVMREQNRRHALVTHVGTGESVEDAAAAVDEQVSTVPLEQQTRLHAVGKRHRAARPEECESHTSTYGGAAESRSEPAPRACVRRRFIYEWAARDPVT